MWFKASNNRVWKGEKEKESGREWEVERKYESRERFKKKGWRWREKEKYRIGDREGDEEMNLKETLRTHTKY